MLKYGIFVKIYLSFFLLTIVVIISQVVLDEIDGSSPFNRMKMQAESSLTLYGQAALAYQQAGAPASTLTQLAEQFKTTSGMDTYLVDSSGKRVNGAMVPQDLTGIAAKVIKNGIPEHIRSDDRILLARPISSPDGKPYVIFGVLERKGFLPPPEMGNPRMPIRITIILALSGIACYLLARYLVMPLISLRDATKRFAAGELSVRISSRIGRRKDEIADLARDFDIMAERIEALMTLQKQLIGDISHELRSPLARLNVALDLARQKTGSEVEHALNRIEEEAHDLNEMIGEVLTLTRLESGSNNIKMDQVNISELVREIAEDADFEAQGSNRGVKINIFDQCSIYGNQELLKRSIENVVRNAIRHTFEHTEVEISITKNVNDTVEIRIRDHGPGVEDGELRNIFLPFYRISESRDRQTGGTGLGLAISERAVLLHRGSVLAENAFDGGLVVCIILPTSNKSNLLINEK
jgi:two-component system, OmpR family, sensor histidine kinase CpxA